MRARWRTAPTLHRTRSVDRDQRQGLTAGDHRPRGLGWSGHGRGDRHPVPFHRLARKMRSNSKTCAATRATLMTRMEATWVARPSWVAVDHPEHPTTRTPASCCVATARPGRDLIIARPHRARHASCARRTGNRMAKTARKARDPRGLLREVDQGAGRPWIAACSSEYQSHEGVIGFDGQRRHAPAPHAANRPAAATHHLGPGRAERHQPLAAARPDIEPTLRAMGEARRHRADHAARARRAAAPMAVFTSGGRSPWSAAWSARAADGRGAGLVVDGIDGRAHYVGAAGRHQSSSSRRAPWSTLARPGAGRGQDVRRARRWPVPHRPSPRVAGRSRSRRSAETVAAQPRHLEALRRAGLVRRVAERCWRRRPAERASVATRSAWPW